MKKKLLAIIFIAWWLGINTASAYECNSSEDSEDERNIRLEELTNHRLRHYQGDRYGRHTTNPEEIIDYMDVTITGKENSETGRPYLNFYAGFQNGIWKISADKTGFADISISDLVKHAYSLARKKAMEDDINILTTAPEAIVLENITEPITRDFIRVQTRQFINPEHGDVINAQQLSRTGFSRTPVGKRARSILRSFGMKITGVKSNYYEYRSTITITAKMRSGREWER